MGEIIQEKLRRIRKEKGLSQKQVADSAGLSIAAYSNIESGLSKSITIDVGKGISEALGIPFTKLFEIEDDQTNIFKIQIEDLEQTVKNYEHQLEEKGLFIDSLLNQLKTVRSHFVDLVIDTYQNWYDEYIDTERSSEWNMEHLTELISKDSELNEIIKKLKSELRWFLRSGIFSDNDYRSNLEMRKENGLPAIDLLKL